MSDSVKDFIAGTMGGFTAKLLDYPLDTVKVLLQTQNSSATATATATTTTTTTSTTATTTTAGAVRAASENVGGSSVIIYRNAWHCFQHTIKTQGVGGLYKGLTSPLLGCMAENALLFWAYSHTKRFAVMATTSSLSNTNGDDKTKTTSSSSSSIGTTNDNSGSSNNNPELTLFQMSLAGAAAGAVVPLVLTPVELIKCRMQVQNSFGRHFNGPLDVMWDILRNEGGIRGLYRGYWSTLLREVPGNFVWYGCYEGTCAYFTTTLLLSSSQDNNHQQTRKKDLPTWVHLLGGALAGVGYWTVCYPLDTVKSRIQTMGGGMVEVATGIYRTEGIRGFFRGWGITILRAAPAHALIFAVYEQTLILLHPRNEDGQAFHRQSALRD